MTLLWIVAVLALLGGGVGFCLAQSSRGALVGSVAIFVLIYVGGAFPGSDDSCEPTDQWGGISC